MEEGEVEVYGEKHVEWGRRRRRRGRRWRRRRRRGLVQNSQNSHSSSKQIGPGDWPKLATGHTRGVPHGARLSPLSTRGAGARPRDVFVPPAVLTPVCAPVVARGTERSDASAVT